MADDRLTAGVYYAVGTGAESPVRHADRVTGWLADGSKRSVSRWRWRICMAKIIDGEHNPRQANAIY